MLHLKNIAINETMAEADFYPEGGTAFGHIVVDVAHEEIVEITHVPGYEIIYPEHAKRQLIRMAKDDNPRPEYRVMWY